MTWTYDEALTTDRDKVRYLIGDTVAAEPYVSDEAIAWHLSEENNNLYRAAIGAVDGVLAVLARKVSKSISGFSLSADQKFAHYQQVRKLLQEKADSNMTILVYAGGITVLDQDTRREDETLLEPAFSRDQGEFPNSPTRRDAYIWWAD